MRVKVLFMDVDGTLTDGKVYLSAQGELMKAFDVKDGFAINHLEQYGIVPVIITGRTSTILERRCEEIIIQELHQGVYYKAEKLLEVCERLGVTAEECAYIGDDVIDLECIGLCGLSGCPSDAIDKVRDSVDYVCKAKGGAGAIREFCNYFLSLDGRSGFDEMLKNNMTTKIVRQW